MSYIEDYDDHEQCAYADELDRDRHAKDTEHQRMCRHFDLSSGEFDELSKTEQQRITWNWRNVQLRQLRRDG